MVGRTNESIFGREQSQRIWGHIFISTIIDKAKALMEEAREGRAGRVSLELSAAPPQGSPRRQDRPAREEPGRGRLLSVPFLPHPEHPAVTTRGGTPATPSLPQGGCFIAQESPRMSLDGSSHSLRSVSRAQTHIIMLTSSEQPSIQKADRILKDKGR